MTATILAQASNYVWAASMLKAAGLPTTANNVNNVVRWMAAEEPPSNWYDRNNPLNASLGTTSTNGTGSYTSLTIAAQQTAAMLRQSNMKGIYNALAANAPLATFSAAVVASPWASGHYGGSPSAIASVPQPPTVAASVNATDVAGVLALGALANQPSLSIVNGPATGCSSSGGIDILGVHIGTQCELKALTGGLLVGLGAAMMIIGFAMMARNTTAGAAVLKAAPGPVGRVSRASSGGSPSEPKLTQADKAQRYRDENPDEVAAAREKRQAAGLVA